MTLRAGTSGFSYKEWKGSFYPEDLPAKKMLGFYGGVFPAVEINNTFYRMPKPEMLTGWRDEVPKTFEFVLKAPQTITHIRRLKVECADALKLFFQTAAALGQQRGPTLFQLPPNMKQDTERLKTFLGMLPSGHRASFEFRHPSWFDETTFSALREHNVALCVAQADDFECPQVATAEHAYFRLRKTEYSDKELKQWAAKVKAHPAKHHYVFFKHEDAGTGPRFARTFEKAFNALG